MTLLKTWISTKIYCSICNICILWNNLRRNTHKIKISEATTWFLLKCMIQLYCAYFFQMSEKEEKRKRRNMGFLKECQNQIVAKRDLVWLTDTLARMIIDVFTWEFRSDTSLAENMCFSTLMFYFQALGRQVLNARFSNDVSRFRQDRRKHWAHSSGTTWWLSSCTWQKPLPSPRANTYKNH